MDFKWILWSMTGILALLFFATYIYGGKGKEKSRLEITYCELLLKYKNDPTKQADIQAAGTAYGKILGLSEQAITSMITKDLA